MSLSNQFKFTSTHEWINPEIQPMTMGISAHAQNLLGDIVFVELPEIGQKVTAGQEIGVLESVKAAADYYAPISGTISEINQAIKNHPELINQDPYGQGWLCKITPDVSTQMSTLVDEQTYQNEMIKE